jgi:hypothetical protein
MLTNTDIAKIVAVVATKEDLRRVEARFDALDGSLNSLATAVQKLAGSVQAKAARIYVERKKGYFENLWLDILNGHK